MVRHQSDRADADTDPVYTAFRQQACSRLDCIKRELEQMLQGYYAAAQVSRFTKAPKHTIISQDPGCRILLSSHKGQIGAAIGEAELLADMLANIYKHLLSGESSEAVSLIEDFLAEGCVAPEAR